MAVGFVGYQSSRISVSWAVCLDGYQSHGHQSSGLSVKMAVGLMGFYSSGGIRLGVFTTSRTTTVRDIYEWE